MRRYLDRFPLPIPKDCIAEYVAITGIAAEV
jgi:hypothetical protein